MAVAVQRERRMRVAESREWLSAKPDEERWELLDGVPVLMSPPSERHWVIAANLPAPLCDPARSAECRELPHLGSLSETIDDFAPIPDVVVRNGPLVAKVPSRSTIDIDGGGRSAYCEAIPAMLHVHLVYQDERRANAWSRVYDERTFPAHGGSDTIAVPRPSVKLPLAEIYVGFSA